jgi:hypothetical protein
MGYSQPTYPIQTQLKGDSVVILTKKQSDNINLLIENQKIRIQKYKTEIKLVNDTNTTLINDIKIKDSVINRLDSLLYAQYNYYDSLISKIDTLENWILSSSIDNGYIYYSWQDSTVKVIDLSKENHKTDKQIKHELEKLNRRTFWQLLGSGISSIASGIFSVGSKIAGIAAPLLVALAGGFAGLMKLLKRTNFLLNLQTIKAVKDVTKDAYDMGKSIKDAIFGKGKDYATRGGKWLLAVAAVFPIVMGVTAGTMASKLTSPSGTETGNLQKQLVDAELEEALTDMRRRKEQALKQEDVPTRKEREIRI